MTIPAAAGTTRYSSETRWWVSTLNLDGMHEELIFTSEDIAAAIDAALAIKDGKNAPPQSLI